MGFSEGLGRPRFFGTPILEFHLMFEIILPTRISGFYNPFSLAWAEFWGIFGLEFIILREIFWICRDGGFWFWHWVDVAFEVQILDLDFLRRDFLGHVWKEIALREWIFFEFFLRIWDFGHVLFEGFQIREISTVKISTEITRQAHSGRTQRCLFPDPDFRILLRGTWAESLPIQ